MISRETMTQFLEGMRGRQPTTGKYRRMCYVLKPGFTWNPLTGYPRNKGCFCGSGEKAKRCCLPKLSRHVREADAAEIRTMWSNLLTGHQTIRVK